MISSSPSIQNRAAFTGNVRARLRRGTLLFRFLVEVNLILGAWYLYWRLTQSLNFNALWFAVPLLIAEIYSYGGSVLFLLGLWRPLERQVKSLNGLTPPMPPAHWPTVDVFIACYNEPPDLVEQTARGALAFDYPVTKLRVYVLDDGNSPQMRSTVERLALEDLKTPRLRQEVERVTQTRARLQERLHSLEGLLPQVERVEQQEDLTRFESLQKALLLLHPDCSSISECLEREQRSLETALYKTELELVELARCRYIARPKIPGKPHHAKAGNINHAIFSGETSGELILTLDADHIPVSHFLLRTVPYFYTFNLFSGQYEKNRIAFVQTPQDFYNIPPGDPFGHEAHLFYGPIQQGKDGLNSAFYTGTNAVLRREALVQVGLKYFSAMFTLSEDHLEEFELVGGMSSNSITEDMNTAMRLHGAGWRSAYHNEVLASGLAPDDLSSTLKQRLRWAQGTIQVLARENPLAKPGLSFWQRWQYFQTMYSYFSGFANVIYIASPIVYLFTGIAPIATYGPEFFLHFLPFFIVNRLNFAVLTWGIPAQETWRSEQYSLANFPLYIQAVWSVLSGRDVKFQVTPKQRQAGVFLGLVKIQLIVSALLILGLLWVLIQYLLGWLHDPWIHLINGAWALYTLALLWGIIRAATWQPTQTDTETSQS